jgi:hypothetical protein
METNETRKRKYSKKNLKEKKISKNIYKSEKETFYFYYTK